jgi:hypothetical protein
MPDNVVEIKVAATGVSEAGAQFDGFSEEVTAALKAISTSAGVTAGDLNILQAVMKTDQEAGIALSATLAQVAESNTAFSAAVRESAAALAVDATATEEVAAASEQLAPALDEVAGSATRARFAAQLLGRELGVPLPRALSSVAAQSELLGPILQAAFPVIAAVALGDILVKVGEKVVALAENFLFLKDAEVEANRVGVELAKETESAFEASAQKQAEILRNAGHYVQAARLEQERILSIPIKPPKLEDKKLSELDPEELKKIKAAYSELIPADLGDRIATIRTRMEELTKEAAGLANPKAISGVEALALGEAAVGVAVINSTRNLNQHNVAIQLYGEQLQHLEQLQKKTAEDIAEAGQKIGSAKDEEAKKTEEAAHRQEAAYKKVEQAIKAKDAAQLDSYKLDAAAQGVEYGPEIELSFYESKLAAESQYKDRKIELEHEIATLSQRILKDAQRQQEEDSKEAAKKSAEINKENARRNLEDLQNSIKEIEAAQKAEAAAIKQGAAEAKRAQDASRKEAGAQNALDSTNRVQPLETQRAQLENQKGQDTGIGGELKRLEAVRDVDRQITQEKTQAALVSAALYADDPVKFADAIKKEVQINAEGQRQIAKDTAAIQKTIEKDVTSVVNALGNDIDKNINKWITGQESFAKAARGAWRDLETGAITSIEHIIEKQIEQMVINQTLSALGVATQKSANAAAQLSAAKTAAANTYAAVSAIPYIGWLLAPPAAAAAFVAVEAFETGGGVTGNGMAFLHANEHVINAPLTSLLQQVAAQRNGGGRSSSSSSNVNVGSVNYKGAQMTDKHFGQMVKRLQRNANQ